MSVVLAPVDGSTRALRAVPWAAKLAGLGGTVVLLRVVPPQPAYAETLFSLVGAEDTIPEIQDAWVRVANADMDDAAALLSESDVAVEQMVAEGEPDEEIVAAAVRRGVEMIAMASHGRGAVGRAIFGSVADRVARTAPVPVLILRIPDEDADPGSSSLASSSHSTVRRLPNGRCRSSASLPCSSPRRCMSCARSTRPRRFRWRLASSARRRRSTQM